ncbi:MFS transporter [Saccharopolyspora sp. WRP15-2]|uniref:MFS transporter n=1 Tax=Saccharopolyspora oryzae TaxID=2997343 RepID=A0ABT4VA84_9PSEU|nr:MFS transporter [Saccharopolyspora oryzae]MDA3630738.1 MFS transporter [Saccharopolyspora oryzae]
MPEAPSNPTSPAARTSVTTPPPLPDSRRVAWSLTGLIVVLYILNASDKAVFGLIAQPLREDLGLSSAEIGFTGSVFFLAYALGGFFAGPLNRMVSLRWSIAIIAIAWGAVMLPLILWATFAVLLLSRMALGFTEGPTLALIYTAAYSWHPPERRGLPGALITSGTAIAKMAVVPVLAIVLAAYGWRATILVLAVASVVWCVPWLAAWRPGPHLAVGERTSTVDEVAGVGAVPWRRVLTTRTFIGCAFVAISAYILITVVLTWLPSYFEKGLGYSRLQSGTMFAIPSVVGLVALVGGSLLSDRAVARGVSIRIVRVVLPCLGVVLSGVLLMGLPWLGSAPLAVAAVSLAYGLVLAIFPLVNTAIVETCPAAQIPGTLGAFLAIQSLGGVIGPWATGFLLDASATPADGYTTTFQLIGMLSAICAAAAIIVVDPVRDREKLSG